MNIILYKKLITNYIRAKDENRPWYLTKVFSSDALLDMQVDSDLINFPSHVTGREAIADTLVKKFAQNYGNVFTYVFDDTVVTEDKKLSCMWLVVMTDKVDGSLRVGYGKYIWHFQHNVVDLFASKLCIELISMNQFPQSMIDQIYRCIDELPYPWIKRDDLQELVDYLPILANLNMAHDTKFYPNSNF